VTYFTPMVLAVSKKQKGAGFETGALGFFFFASRAALRGLERFGSSLPSVMLEA
jgi:hypothetical protein